MKKIYSFVLMAAMLLVGTNASAAEGTPVVGTTGAHLQAAINAAANGATLYLQNGIELTQGEPIWLGTTSVNGDFKSITLDLNGNDITCVGSDASKAVYMFVLSHGELKIINTAAGEATIEQSGSASESSQIFSVYGNYQAGNINTWSNGYFSHLEIGENVKLLGNVGSGISIDMVCKQAEHALMQASNNQIDYVTNVFSGTDATQGYGYAYGVRVDVKGKIDLAGSAKTYGIKANGWLETSLKHRARRTNSSYAYVASGTDLDADTACAPFIHVYESAHIQSSASAAKSTAIYSSGWAKWLIEGTCIGATGVNIKSGKLYIHDAKISSNAENTIAPSDTQSATEAGSAIVVNSTSNYTGKTEVTISGDTELEGAGGFAIQEVVSSVSAGSKVENITIEGGTFNGGGQGAIAVSESGKEKAVIYGGTITGNVNVTNGDITDLLPNTTGAHATEVVDPVSGEKTYIIVPEAAPATISASLNNWGIGTFSAKENVKFAYSTEGLKAYKATVMEGENLHLDEIAATEGFVYIPAGTGVILYHEGVNDVDESLTVVSDAIQGLSGTNNLKPATAFHAGMENVYILHDNMLYLYTGSEFKAGKAFLQLPANTSAPQRIRMVFHETEEEQQTEAVSNVEAASVKAVKFVENGEILIRRGENVYNLQGQIVK